MFGNRLCNVMSFYFFEFLTPSTWGGHNFLISNMFLTKFTMLDVSREGVQVLFRD
jgi:hypothetical protein